MSARPRLSNESILPSDDISLAGEMKFMRLSRCGGFDSALLEKIMMMQSRLAALHEMVVAKSPCMGGEASQVQLLCSVLQTDAQISN